MLNSAYEAYSPNFREKLWVKITVTQSHIDCGKRGACGACPIALSMFELLGEKWEVQQTRVFHAATHYQIELPHHAQNFISDFDAGRRVEPFDFSVPIPLAFIPEALQGDLVIKSQSAGRH